jgi:plasmid stability protein
MSEDTMPNLSIKNVPESVLKKLRQRAKRNQRSLQGELLVIVNEAAAGPSSIPTPSVIFDPPRSGTKTIEQIAAELRARHPEPITDAPLGVDIIRAARDAR